MIAANLRGPAAPAEVPSIDALELGGRGLGVVANLSGGRCGVHTTRLCGTGQPGKGVWFAIPGGWAAEPARRDVPSMPERPGPDARWRAGLRRAADMMFLDVKAACELTVPGRY